MLQRKPFLLLDLGPGLKRMLDDILKLRTMIAIFKFRVVGVTRSPISISALLPSTSMPPKSALTTEEIDALATRFGTIGLSQAKAKDAAKSPKIAEPLKHLVEAFKLSERSVNEKQASLLVHLAPPSSRLAGDEEIGYIVDKIIDGKLKSTDQVNGGSGVLLESHPPLDLMEMKRLSCHKVL